jgi:RHS repeat-associated protein
MSTNAQLLAVSSVGNRFLFTGREYLAEIGLYDYRNRFYSPSLGRFLQTDPIGFSAGDENLYRYVFNNSITVNDPDGLEVVCTPYSVVSEFLLWEGGKAREMTTQTEWKFAYIFEELGVRTIWTPVPIPTLKSLRIIPVRIFGHYRWQIDQRQTTYSVYREQTWRVRKTRTCCDSTDNHMWTETVEENEQRKKFLNNETSTDERRTYLGFQ